MTQNIAYESYNIAFRSQNTAYLVLSNGLKVWKHILLALLNSHCCQKTQYIGHESASHAISVKE